MLTIFLHPESVDFPDETLWYNIFKQNSSVITIFLPGITITFYGYCNTVIYSEIYPTIKIKCLKIIVDFNHIINIPYFIYVVSYLGRLKYYLFMC